MSTLPTKKDPLEQALAEYEASQKEFEAHWIWKELKCTPDQFFKALKQKLKDDPFPPEQWKAACEKAKARSRLRVMERRQKYDPAHLKLLGAIRV